MRLKEHINKIYARLTKVLTPTLSNSYFLYEDILNILVDSHTKWLDLGCGHQILPSWFPEAEESQFRLVNKCKTIVGIDYDLLSLQEHSIILSKVRGHIDRLPFIDNSFDLVTANMVVEHLENPAVAFREISRVLKPGGSCLIHTTNALGYLAIIGKLVPRTLRRRLIYLIDGRTEDDVFDTYFRANTEKTLDALAGTSGLIPRKIQLAVTTAQFRIFPPILFLEVIWVRLLMTKNLARYRTNIIAILAKPDVIIDKRNNPV